MPPHPDKFVPYEQIQSEQLKKSFIDLYAEALFPYGDYLMGDSTNLKEFIGQRLSHKDSEFSIANATVLIMDEKPMGMFSAFDPTDLSRFRLADLLKMIKYFEDNQQKELFKTRIKEMEGIFSPLMMDQCFLSMIGILPEMRKQGHGELLMREYIRCGIEKGFKHFRLNVSSANVGALRLYEQMGFKKVFEAAFLNENENLTYRCYELE